MDRFTNLLLKACLIGSFCCTFAFADFTSVSLTAGSLAGTTLEHKINLNDPNANGQDTITIRYTVPRTTWVSVGVNPTGTGMLNGEVVIGKPAENNSVRKYKMTGKTGNSISELPNQTLINPSLEQTGGNTILTYTKLLVESGEYTITAGASNTFIAGFGFSNNFGFHQGYGVQDVTLDAGTIATPTGPTDVPAPAPTDSPVAAPTDIPVMSPTPPPPEAGFRQVSLSGSLAEAEFQYRLNRNDVMATDGAAVDTITIEYSCPGNVWVSVGVSEFGAMVPAKAVIGFPDSGDAPLRYFMEGRAQQAVTPLPEDQQTLIDPQVSFANDRTTLRYTKPIVPNEALEIHADGRSTNFIGACGAAAGPSFHQRYGSFEVVVEEGDTEAPTVAAPFAAPTNPPGAEVLELTEDLAGSTLSYRFTPDDPSTGGKDSITVTYTAPVTAWVSVGASESGGMVGSDAVIGIPATGEVKKYKLSSKADLSGVNVLPDEKQTLVNAAITQANGMTTLTYTKILVEEGEIRINRVGENIFIAAHGSGNTLGFHTVRGAFSLSGKVIERDNSLWALHGLLAEIAWGLLCPLAILAGLFRKRIPGKGRWYMIHRTLQGLTVVLTIASVAVAIAALNQETPTNSSANHFSADFVDGHRLIGLVVVILAILQGAGGIMRPHLPPKPEEQAADADAPPPQPEEKSGVRKAWEVLHRWLGAGLLALTWYQIYLGIFWYYEIFFDGESETTLIVYYAVIGFFGGAILIGAAMRILEG